MMDFPGGSDGKEPACQCRRSKRHRFNPWVRKMPWRRKWQPTPVSLPGRSHRQRTPGGYSPAAATAKLLQSCPTLCDPIDGSPPGFPSLGFSGQEHWSGLPFPSPMHESEKWKWSRSVVSDSSEPMDCSLPGSSVHGIFQAKVLEWGAIALSGGCKRVSK